eukprot:m.123641 g.123641  ORF g.123641 m.123641 type:complete len:327 (-) comp16259_c0_seq4:1343-2323(-)
MAARKVQTLLVVGGRGMLGRAVCRAAVQRGLQVISLSRSGAPPSSEAADRAFAAGVETSSSHWMQDVEWIKGDALKPETYKEHLARCQAVVHSVGTLMENNTYKQLLCGREAAQYDFSQQSFETINRDTLAVLANAAAETPGVQSLVFVSAAAAPPGVDARYLQTKREAEELLLGQQERLRGVVLRPGFLFEDVDPLTSSVAVAVRLARLALACMPASLPVPAVPAVLSRVAPSLANAANSATSSFASRFAPPSVLTAPPEPISTTDLAAAVLNAVQAGSDVRGVYEAAALRALVDRGSAGTVNGQAVANANAPPAVLTPGTAQTA